MIKRFLAVVVTMAALQAAAFAEETETKVNPEEQVAVVEAQAPTIKPSTNPDNGKLFGDWLKECEIIVEGEGEGKGKEVEICQLVQSLVDPDSKRTMLKAAIGYVPNKEQAVMVISLPLGIYLPPGVQMRVDDNGKVGRIPVNTCLPAGCQAGAELDADFTARLKKGNKLNVTFGNPDGQPVTAEMSLSGITAGLESFNK